MGSYEIDYDTKDLLEFSQKIESIPGVEILSMGKSLEVIKDLGNAKTVSYTHLRAHETPEHLL